MISTWKVSNFKSIREETELEFGPLTILAGANSSGKSTIIQSILLIAQTLAHKGGSRPIVLNGSLASLGQFDDLKTNGSSSDQITIGFSCQPVSDNDFAHGLSFQSDMYNSAQIYLPRRGFDIKEGRCEVSFDATSSSSDRDFLQIHPRLFATQLSCIARDRDNVDQVSTFDTYYSPNAAAKVKENYRFVELEDEDSASFSYPVSLNELSQADVHEMCPDSTPVGCTLQHFLPRRIVCVVDKSLELANMILGAIISGNFGSKNQRFFDVEVVLSDNVLEILRDLLADYIDIESKDYSRNIQNPFKTDNVFPTTLGQYMRWLRFLPKETRIAIQETLGDSKDLEQRIFEAVRSTDAEYACRNVRLPAGLSQTASYLDNFFTTSVKYLGPLRDAPKPLYPLAPSADPLDVGLRGEYTASVLELHKNKKIRYIPSEHFSSPDVVRSPMSRTLETAVVDWLRYLGVANSVVSHDMGKLGHELKVGLNQSEKTHDLTHVGVGVSQVLPILVMCLLADTDATLVFEQPELHLHPKVQTLLADFFLSMALCKKQCIVETHSEYFVDRLRFRIAAAKPGKEINDMAKIYFVEKSSHGSTFRQVVVNEYGAIPDWPDGFFDQSQRQAEEILIAAAQKRRLRRTNPDV
jgi:predicted ATPase